MLHFSMSSLLMSVLSSNLLLILLYGIFRNTEYMMDIGYQLLTVFLVATLLRFLFPFELFCCTTLHLPQGISKVAVFIKDPILSIGTLRFSLWHVFLVLWLVGAIVGIYLLIRSSQRFSRTIRVLGTDLTHQEPCCSTLQRICEEQHQPNNFQVMKMPKLSSPMITGLLHPVILIPDTLILRPEEWYYILSHEAAHYFRHDLWLKLFSSLLCILYWWNPFIYAFKRQISTMLELRIDRYVTALADPREKFRYMECLSHIASLKENDPNSLTISFGVGGKQLLQRCKLIGDGARHKQSKRKQIVLSAAIIILYVFSTFFIFEPVYLPPGVEDDSYELTTDTSYFIVNPDGGYDLYMEGQFVITVDAIDETLTDLKVHQSLEELP